MGGIMMEYYEIGQRIRKIRKARGLSQEQLAERAGISATHMSHIETANTKLSLPVFVAIAEVLEISADALLYDEKRESVSAVQNDIASVLERCDARQARIIAEIVKGVKQALDMHDC